MTTKTRRNEMTIQEFADRVQVDTNAEYLRKGFTLAHHNIKVKVVPGRKYTKVNVGGSGKYMVVNETGEIFGIKAYGVIHRGEIYGMLDTADSYDWGGYRAVIK